jgi:hypothetical protein
MFYEYDQNNSGGDFYADEKVQPKVIIEANSEAEAERIAVDDLGIYFNGVEDERDCECCGSRWSSYVYTVAETKEDLNSYISDPTYSYDTVVHFADGTKRYLIHKNQFGLGNNPIVSDTGFYMQPERKRR